MRLHYVDPHAKHGRWYLAVERFSRSRQGQFMAHNVFPRIDPWLYRVTGGRYPWILGGPSTAPLTTIGAKTGQHRIHQITYFHDGPDPIVTASNYGGAKHPQWYYNLKAHPECEYNGGSNGSGSGTAGAHGDGGVGGDGGYGGGAGTPGSAANGGSGGRGAGGSGTAGSDGTSGERGGSGADGSAGGQ